MYSWILTTLIVLLTGCASAPQPPTVDGSDRQIINDAETKEYIIRRLFSKNKPQQQTEPIISESTTRPRSRIIRIYFPYNSARFSLDMDQVMHLLSSISGAQRLDIRGRTDGQHPSIADEKMALNRALAVQRYFIKHNVTPAIMSINYLSAGDYIGDNTSKFGRMINRRVDIEIFYP